ncbi:hypothetical protein C900_02303 [Fulvivirga imtechensis AK7]|uniref:Uncharacterized protein n=1 Tax=Fulvivirga imtechensis AK7 TaxID=1237149 RepID=L8JTY7_9BACT|nr:hypothetical protein [Fulvivirga imtechensis]ELR71718.1 hypothetical protein C900_02303 [Fulvivirga imtechensis AK7]
MTIAILKLLGKYYWILLLIIIALLFYSRQSQKRLAEDYRQMADLQEIEVMQWKDKAGKNRARAEMAEIKAENAKHVLNEDLKRMLKEEVGNIKRNLIGYSSINASTEGEIHASGRDTLVVLNNQAQPVKATRYSYSSKHLDFQALTLPGVDSLIADYRVYHNFEIFYYYKRPGRPPFNVLRRKQAVAEIKFDNPGTQADSVYSIVLERKKGLLKAVLGR